MIIYTMLGLLGGLAVGLGASEIIWRLAPHVGTSPGLLIFGCGVLGAVIGRIADLLVEAANERRKAAA